MLQSYAQKVICILNQLASRGEGGLVAIISGFMETGIYYLL